MRTNSKSPVKVPTGNVAGRDQIIDANGVGTRPPVFTDAKGNVAPVPKGHIRLPDAEVIRINAALPEERAQLVRAALARQSHVRADKRGKAKALDTTKAKRRARNKAARKQRQ